MNTLVAALVLLLAQKPPSPSPPPDAVRVEGRVVVFISPVGPAGDAIRQQRERLRDELQKRKVKAVEATPTLLLLGEDNPLKRTRKVDFRRTPRFAGTVLFMESHDAQIYEGLEDDQKLLARLATYIERAEKAK